jgi:hypothetical protein
LGSLHFDGKPLLTLSVPKKTGDPYFWGPGSSLNTTNRTFFPRKGKTMNKERMNLESEILAEVEELEAKIAPDSSASFLD